jgi:hypothetical protein
MVKEWIHINYNARDGWHLPIITAINNCQLNDSFDADFWDLGLHISTRLDMLPFIYGNIYSISENLFSVIKNTSIDKYFFTKNKEGYALPIDIEIKYNLLIMIDSL